MTSTSSPDCPTLSYFSLPPCVSWRPVPDQELALEFPSQSLLLSPAMHGRVCVYVFARACFAQRPLLTTSGGQERSLHTCMEPSAHQRVTFVCGVSPGFSPWGVSEFWQRASAARGLVGSWLCPTTFELFTTLKSSPGSMVCVCRNYVYLVRFP